MISRIKGLGKILWYEFRYGKNIHFNGIPRFDGKVRINLKKGTVFINKGLSMKNNSYLAIVDGGKLTIGTGVSIGRNSIIVCHDCISIGDRCRIAPNVLIYDHDHRFDSEGVKTGFNTSPVVIEKGCWIGAGVIILRGSHIGEGCVIGAGTIVKGNIPPHTLVTSDRKINTVPINKQRN